MIKSQQEKLAPDQREQDFFEYFTAQQILKNEDLSVEEIQEAITDGARDGGIDALFFFIDSVLIRDENEASSTKVKKSSIFRLVVIQSSIESGFKEGKVINLKDSLNNLLSFDKNEEYLTNNYNEAISTKIIQFKKLYIDNADKFPLLEIAIYYVNKSIDPPHINVVKKSQEVISDLKALYGSEHFKIDFQFISASDLWLLANQDSSKSYDLIIDGSAISTTQRDAVCFVKLEEYYKFITTDTGDLKKPLFESNVRDYQGNVEVNKNIEATLNDTDAQENFWWLNNGITVICSNYRITGNKLTIEDPQIVNGLQTSNQIYYAFQKLPNLSSNNRHILLRIVNPMDTNSRDKIIKATNSQTAMLPAQLTATDQIQKDIESFFESHGLYYDRRKNSHRNQKRPIDKIIGISALAQSVHAILNQKPHESRRQPASLIKEKKTYDMIFVTKKYDLQVYLNCALIIKCVEKFMKSSIASGYSKDLKYHLATYSVGKILAKKKVNAQDILGFELVKLTDTFLLECIDEIVRTIRLVDSETPFNTILKRSESTERVLKLLEN
ncbi:hypothetical protein A8135_02025 [Legionella jamestowniensis]|uniref:Abortive phage infection protein C-terminal domain-containing protein n=1 Tax=Legionella jamestowniensis TaxID=455 RepID=A0ABX2XUX1_9GAMM|nr:AIPR family protein [Legionella jamestowniensis]OCH98021.1 hypothetical protein A8135_02025 [Legionella jamestowniensis]